jgi:hypothetical protein
MAARQSWKEGRQLPQAETYPILSSSFVDLVSDKKRSISFPTSFFPVKQQLWVVITTVKNGTHPNREERDFRPFASYFCCCFLFTIKSHLAACVKKACQHYWTFGYQVTAVYEEAQAKMNLISYWKFRWRKKGRLKKQRLF